MLPDRYRGLVSAVVDNVIVAVPVPIPHPNHRHPPLSH